MSPKMLQLGQEKIEQLNLSGKVELKMGNAHEIPFPDNSFDITTLAFGIRNMENPLKVLSEIHRVLTFQGKTLILEFGLPQNIFIRNPHLFYLRNIVPVIGGIFSGHYHAYRYINQTIEAFPYGEDFCKMMRESGFKNVKASFLMLGVAIIYQGEKL